MPLTSGSACRGLRRTSSSMLEYALSWPRGLHHDPDRGAEDSSTRVHRRSPPVEFFDASAGLGAYDAARRERPLILLRFPARRRTISADSPKLSWANNPKVAGSNAAPATMKNEGLADAAAASPFRLPRLHPGSCFAGLAPARDAAARIDQDARRAPDLSRRHLHPHYWFGFNVASSG